MNKSTPKNPNKRQILQKHKNKFPQSILFFHKHFKLERPKTMSGNKKIFLYEKTIFFPCHSMKSGSLSTFFSSLQKKCFFFSSFQDVVGWIVLSYHWLLFIKSLPENNDFFFALIALLVISSKRTFFNIILFYERKEGKKRREEKMCRT